jgi:ATP-dependent RNA helicase DeaD
VKKMFTNQSFKSWNLPSQLQAGLDNLGWEFATQVQKDTIPLARKGIDIIGQARTG